MAGVRATVVLPVVLPVWLLAGRAVRAATATAASLAHADGTTLLTIETRGAPGFSLFTLGAPPRVVIDLPGLAWSAGAPPPGAGLVRAVRVGLNRPGVTRVVLDLAQTVAVARADIARADRAASAHGTTLSIALVPAPESVFLRQVASSEPAAAASRPDAQRQDGAAAQRQRQRLPLVMLDPGHGGRDPGAIGRGRTQEKHVTLAAAVELRRLLERGGRVRVAMTRTRDVFVPLPERVRAAQRAGADLFVSLHADALDDRAVRGASVYTLSERASDPLAERVARNENGADRFAGPDFAGVSPEAARILIALVRRETLNGAARMARITVASLAQDLVMLPNSHRFAGFVVLKAPDVPSVLVEMGFLSNPSDEALLRQPEHRRVVAAAMARAIETWAGEAATLQASG